MNNTPHWLKMAFFIQILSILYPYINQRLIYFSFQRIIPQKLFGIVKNTLNESFFKTILYTIIHFYLEVFLLSGFIFFILSLFHQVQFKKVILLIIYGELILFFIQPLLTLILIIKNLYGITNLKDLSISIGLEVIFPKINKSSFLNMVLMNVNVITLWWVIYLNFGLEVLLNLKKMVRLFYIIVIFCFYFFVQYFITLINKIFLITL